MTLRKLLSKKKGVQIECLSIFFVPDLNGYEILVT